MREATELRATILDKASALFSTQGYSATSIKQIAGAAGCTTAALYYYFEQGKSQILREVVRSYSVDVAQVFASVTDAASLQEFLLHQSQALSRAMPELARRLSWLLVEFPKLPVEDRSSLHALLLGMHERIASEIGRWIADEDEARRLAWLVFCTFFGYEQVFLTLDLGRSVSFGYEELARTMVTAFGGVAE